MKKHLVSIAVALVVLVAVSPVFGEDEPNAPVRPRIRAAGVAPRPRGPERPVRRAEPPSRLVPVRRAAGPQLQIEQLDRQIDELEAEQNQVVDDLRKVLELAQEEKAKQTAEAVGKLIAKRQKTYQEKLAGLQQRRRRLERIRAERPDRPDQVRRRTAPAFELDSFDGKQISLAKLKGKIVVLEWFNFECPFSLYHYETKPTMIDLAEKYKDKNVVWLVVNSTSHTTTQANLDFAKKHKLAYPILNDKPGKVGKQFGAQTTPHIFIIDAKGRIAYNGAIDNAPLGKVQEGEKLVNYVDQALGELVAGKPVSVPETKPYGCTVKYPQQ